MRSKTTGAVIDRPKLEISCRHHWIIDTAVGVTSKGVCKLCGAEKEFLNVIDDSIPKDEIASLIESVDLNESDDETEDDTLSNSEEID